MAGMGRKGMIVIALLCAVLVSAVAADKPVMSLICFQGYAEDSWVKPFEQKYNCTVKISYGGTVEEIFAKVKAAPNEYNIVSISPGEIKQYREADLLQIVDTKKLANYNKMAALFREHPYNKQFGGGTVHIPIVWGTQTITVNTDRIPAEKLARFIEPGKKTLSLDVLTSPDFKGQTAFFDESPNVTKLAAMHLGIKDIFNFKGDDWQRVQDRLYAWKKNARTFTTGLDSEFSVLTGEDALIVLGGNDALLNMKLEDAGLRKSFRQFAMTEGTITWIDGWAVTKPSTGKSLDLAMKYIDMMIGDEVQTELAKLIGFGLVNPAGAKGFNFVTKDSCPWYQDIKSFPTRLEIIVPEEDPARRIELWNKVKAMP